MDSPPPISPISPLQKARYYPNWSTARIGALLMAFVIYFSLSAGAQTLNATFSAATDVIATGNGYTAAGTVNLTLNFAPPTGTNLTVVNNTSLNFISGAFSNLAQGQVVNLSYGGVVYPFVANYYGGTGNDLVLVWKNNRAYAWGNNNKNQLGVSVATPLGYLMKPTPVDATGALAGKTILALAGGGEWTLALCSDGTVVAWGKNDHGQLGINSISASQSSPTLVNTTSGVSALYGKNVIAIAASGYHSLALCSDGTIASWGWNNNGQLGNNSTTDSSAPVAVNTSPGTSALNGKTVISIATGTGHSLALCSDGTIAAWGTGSNGALGNGSTNNVYAPNSVITNGQALNARTVIAISAGYFNSYALCLDGTIGAWGINSAPDYLGDGSTTDQLTPTTVSTSSGFSALYSKTVKAITTGGNTTRALCSDGTFVGWGINGYGAIGDNSIVSRKYPVLVNVASGTSALYGKTVSSIASGYGFSLATCSDGTVTSWGDNTYGELGDNSTTQRNAAVLVDQSTLAAGERMSAVFSGSQASHALAVVATPPSPIVTTLAANNSGVGGAVLNGTVNANGDSVAVSFDYGPTTAYGTNVAGTPATLNGTSATAVSATISGLTPGATYHCRVNAGSVSGNDLTFTATPSNNANLSNLILSTGTLSPSFTSGTTSYTASVATGTNTLTVTPTVADSTATVAVNGTSVTSGTASGAINLVYGSNVISTEVTAQDGSKKTYTVTTTRPVPTSLAATFNTATDVPISGSGITVTGSTVNFTLNYAPTVGTNLTVVNNTGLGFINGTFSNLAQGQTVSLSYGGTTYNFVANYYGGTGNDLVLQWANNRLVAWGANANGQLGNGSSAGSTVPLAVSQTGALTGKTILAIAEGAYHSLALCSDGTLVAWGANSFGQLGNGNQTDIAVPVAVNQTGVLSGKTVVAISAGMQHSLALCSDGTVAAWGRNTEGELGNNSTTLSSVPVLVDTSGVLFGKTVSSIVAGGGHNLALCSDGTLVAWGNNGDGEIGNHSTSQCNVPVLVDVSSANGSALFGKTVVALAAGDDHSVALCSDGTVTAWGFNTYGALGNNSSTSSSVPVAVSMNGVLAGKSVTAAAGGVDHVVALCSDGTLAAWGYNNAGQLGNNSTTDSHVPVLVYANGVLNGKTVTGVAAGLYHSLALCSDGTLAAWGYDGNGELGNQSTTTRTIPVLVSTAGLAANERFISIASNNSGESNLAVVASPAAAAAHLVVQQPLGAALPSGSSTVSFGLGGTSQTCLIQNTGASNLTGISVSITGTNSGDFSVSSPPPTSLAPGASALFTVAFAPSGSGTRSSTLQIASSDPDNNPFSISLSGSTGTALAASYTTGSEVPLAASAFTATGKTVSFTLNYAPTPGTVLTVVNNNGLGFINGKFSNLAQGQLVPLSYNGATYNFVANYYGGTGNDLVLQWAYNRLAAWGSNSNGQLGNGNTTNSSVLVPVNASGVLAGKTILTIAEGGNHSLALCSDGTLAAWGSNSNGQLGNNSTTDSSVPVTVNQSGVLAGKTVVAVAAGALHSLALCSDGTLAAWGYNTDGELGNNSTADSHVPVAVNMTGLLYGKTVTSIVSGGGHNLVLCSDGTLAAWGYNWSGQLGNNSSTTGPTTVPVAVDVSAADGSALAGKTVVALAAGDDHSLVLCADGTLATWGQNPVGELGINSTLNTRVPAAVSMNGVLAGKTVTAMAAGLDHNLVLCADGTLAAWGFNSSGQLGNGGTTNGLVPVLVNTAGVLSGKTITNVAAGWPHSLALCSDGTLLAWGGNSYGQLGNGSTTASTVPLAVNLSSLASGERIVTAISDEYANHNLALIAVPHPQIVVQQPVGTNLASGSSSVNYALRSISQTFTILNSGSNTLSGIGVTITGTNASDFSLSAAPATTVAPGASTTFTVAFTPGSTGNRNATLQIASNDYTTSTFSIALTGNGNPTLAASYGSGSDVPVITNGFTATGNAVNLTLNFAPTAGMDLMLVNNTSATPINGTFSNLPQGQAVALSYGGSTYNFVADYFSGTGNDLVLLLQGPGALDFSFGTQGRVVLPIGSGDDKIQGVVMQPDGKIVTAGYYYNGTNNNDWAVARLNTDGSLDTSFNSNGKATIDFRGGDDRASCVSLQADGKIVVAGFSTDASNPNASSTTLARFSSNGTLDTSFGTNGKVVTQVPSASWSDVYAIAIQPDGKIVVSGRTNDSVNPYVYGILRYNINGTLDSSFGTAGVKAFGFSGNYDLSNGIVLQKNGKIVVSGTASILNNPFVGVTRLNSDGTYDSSFAYGSAGGNAGSAIVLQTDGKPVLSGNANGHFYVARLNVDGGYDSSFGGTGYAQTALGSGTDIATGLAMQSDGRIVVAGYSYDSSTTFNDFAVVRYNADGSLNTGFHGTGKVTTSIGSGSASAQGIAMQSDGKIVVAGYSSNGSNLDFTIVRYLGDTVHNATFATPTDVPLTSNGFSATGQTITFTLNYAPTVGTNLTVVNNTSLGFINGTFSNLAQGQAVSLTYNGTTYPFVANYYGGTGNDLVLQWAYNRLVAWGANSNGQLGNNSSTNSSVPIAVNESGVLAGKTVIATAVGGLHSLALCSDGTLAAWGGNAYGQLGNGSTTDSNVPVLVNQTGVLAGKTVVAVAAGYQHSLVLCSDGTMAAWGWNSYFGSGQLGNGSTIDSSVPVAVDTSGVLNGKTVTSIAAGYAHNLALCSDGTLVSWGNNSDGQLGNNNSGTPRSVPVLVDQTSANGSVLYGKLVVALGAGIDHSMAVCADGTLAAWGYNGYGQLGINTSVSSAVPIAVNMAGVLAGKNVTSAVGGDDHIAALCADGTLSAWGLNSSGQLGNNSTTNWGLPVLISTSGVLASRSVVTISGGGLHNLALCSDGKLVAWGDNSNGQLGNGNTTNSTVPVLVTTSGLSTGERIVAASCECSANHNLALVATPAHPQIVVQQAGATLTSGSAAVSYAFSGTTQSFTILNDGAATLSGIGASFSGSNAADFTLTSAPATTLPPGASTTFSVMFASSGSGTRSATMQIASNDPTDNPFTASLIGAGSRALAANYTTGNEVPLSSNGFTATGSTVNFSLNYAPAVGAVLTVVNNTGLSFINGTFSNLAQGQLVPITFNGVTYNFVANYYGGTGNDLVLQWAYNRLVAWGSNSNGQLGNNSTINSSVPVSVAGSGVLAGKTILSIAEGWNHNLILCSDGTLAAWGANSNGQLGNGGTTDSSVPVLVNQSGVLAGKTVVAVAAGEACSFALCSDGTLASWGLNTDGELGNGSNADCHVPVTVNTAGILAGKNVVSISAGGGHSLALCDDGSLAAWGYNAYGDLGNNSFAASNVPVALDVASADGSALYGKSIVAIAAGADHSIAICSDGTAVAWGYNGFGGLGNNSTVNNSVPVAVNMAGVLSGKNVSAASAGADHTLALCSDGTLAVWGYNAFGQLGNGSMTDSHVPTLVNTAGVLFGKTVVSVSAGASHNLVLCSDGTLVTWGRNVEGELGNNSTVQSNVPVKVSGLGLANGERFVVATSSENALHNLALIAVPHPQIVVQQPVGTNLTSGSSTVNYAFRGTSQTFTIQNSGSNTLTGIGVSIVGTNAGDFSMGAAPATTLAPGASTTFTLSFAPTGTDSRSATLQIASNDYTTSSFSIVLTGNGNTALAASYSSGSTVPITSNGFTASGSNLNLTLAYAPAPFSTLTVVNNTSAYPITGTFGNLAQGQPLTLSYGGSTYNFFADYFGGDGNDLVLVMQGPGVLDYSFGTRGRVTTPVGSADNFGRSVQRVAMQSDGKIIVAGETYLGSNNLVGLTRYNADGSLDSGFNGTGIVTTSINGYSYAYSRGVAIQNDGKIVISGRASNTSSDGNVVIVRYNTNGTLDTTFNGNGIKIVDLGGNDSGENVTVQADGKIVVVGETTTDFATVRVNSDGSLDTTFGTSGIVLTDLGAYDQANGVAIQSDGKILAGGSSTPGSNGGKFAMVRYTSNGSLDTTFNGTGKVTVALGSDAAGNALALQSDGKVILAGRSYNGTDYDFGLVRFNSNGTLDASFGTSGIFTAPVLSGEDSANDVALQADGKIIAVGKSSTGTGECFSMIRCHATGVLDTTFGGTGKISTAFGSVWDGGFGVAIQVDGKVVLSGYSYNGGNYNFAAARYLGDTSHSATFASATDVPMSSSGFTATGQTVNLTLNYVPTVGTNLTVINNTGLKPIGGTFSNLAQGQAVAMTYNGTTYNFVANYFGGSGNDLVLQWAYNRLLAWGDNNAGELGINSTTTQMNLPTAVVAAAPLYGKTVTSVSAGNNFSLTVCADGTVAALGTNAYGQLGNGSTSSAQVAVAVTQSGVLAGKTVVAVAAGGQHSLALCSDGTLSAWGSGGYGQLGNNSTLNSAVPVLVDTTGALFGKRVVAIGAGFTHSVALCSDGTVVCWGDNSLGQLGNNSTTRSYVPVAVSTAGILSGKTVMSVAVGYSHTLALCTDGSAVAWGLNTSGQLGNNSSVNSSIPVAVATSGLLSGRKVAAITAGGNQSLVLCSDGTLAAWGSNDHGQLGNNSVTTSFATPQAVDLTGVLAGKTITSIGMGYRNGLALCSDGSMAAWGWNANGQLGNNSTTDSLGPVAVNNTMLAATESFVAVVSGSDANHVLGIAATTAPAPSISVEQPVGAPLVSNSGTQSYGSTVVSGTKSKTFLIRNNGTATLSGISLSLSGTGAAQYAVTANPATTLAPGDSTTFTLAFTPASAGVKPATLNIASNVSGALNPFVVKLTGTGSNSLNATYVTGTEQPASAANFTASGKTISFTLNYVPLTGTSLMVVNNTGPAFINGVFSNLAQGQTVALSYNGVTYNFIANYYGGTGNDLVLQWAGIRLLAWGKNVSGTLGNNSTTQSNAPVAVNMSGVLSGKTIMALACADRHSLALCTDGTLAAWGANSSGQIGDGTTINRLLPVLVNTTGVLAGKTVVSIAAGYDFSVAVCSDGSVATWGMNSNGQLGEGTTTNHFSPVLVNTAGALAGKLVTALAAGADYCVAQCSDGSVAAWGDNSSGQLGNNSSIDSHVPVAVDTLVADGSALAGRTVVAVAAGQYHSLALCSDGTLVGWGDGSFGELGNNSTNSSLVPVTVDVSQADGSALAGRNIVSIGAGQFHSMALCSDGALATWGDNSSGPGQLGVSGIDFSIVPLSINGTAALTGKTVSGIAAGQTHNVALMTDGTLSAWADNSLGQLGVGTTVSSSLVPVAVSTAALAAGESVVKVVTGSTASHSISVVAIPLSTATGPAVTTNAATNVGKTSVTFNGLTNPNGLATTVYFEYGLTTSYGSQTATQSLGNGTTSQTVVDTSSTLQPNTTYHYRINATNSVGNVVGSDVVFTTLADPPTAVSAATTAITNTTATLSGAVNPNGRATNVYFEFGPTILYGNTTPVQPLGVGTSAVNITAAITGLSPNTTYHCHIVATNAGGTASGSDITFTTTNAGIPTAVPSVTTGSVANVTTTTATLQGQVNPNGGITNAYFEYGTTTSYGGTSANLGAGSGTSPGSLSADISALQPGTLYHYHLVAQNSLGTTLGADATFTTLYLPPTVTTGSSSVASTTSVNVNGTVNANNASAQVFFDYGTDGVTFPSSVGATPATVTGSSSTTVSAVLPNLLQGTTYYYRVRATSAGGTSTGSVASFQVAILSGLLQVFPAAPPSATGSVTMTLNPSGINSGWRIVGELQWRSSGSTATGLITSDLNIEYRPVPGYIEPPQETVSVVSGQAAVQVSRDYYVAASSGSGGISVTLKPDSIAASTVTAASRAQWRFLGEDDTQWRDSGTTVSSLIPGSYSVECKPVSGRATPSLATVIVSNGQTSAPTITYFLSDTPSGVSPSVLSFSTVSTDQTKPYAHVGQIRSSVGVSTGFVVMPRVVATAGHVVFDDGTLSTAQGLQWLFERDAGNYEPVPQTPRGYYIFDGYTAQRAAENTPGTSSPQSQTLDVAAMYFLADAGRGGSYGGFLASDLAANEFLLSSANKMLVGYPVDGITISNQGRMFATPPANVNFTAAYGRTFTTADISSVGGNSGGPLCVQYQGGAYYPAAVYLGGTGQTVVRAIDSAVIDLFNRAQVSGNGGANNTGGGITQTSVTAFGSVSNPGAIAVTIAPAAAVSAGGGWRLSPETGYRQSGAQKSGLSAGTYVLQLTTVSGYQAPTPQTVTVAGGQVTSITFTYATALTAQQTWRQTYFGVTTGTGNAADTANPAGDGIPNLMKYALNLDPTKSSKLPTSANLNGSNLEYNYTRSTTAVNGGTQFLVEWSDDLSTWSSTGVTQTVISDNGTVQQVKASMPAGSGGHRFVHLRVQ